MNALLSSIAMTLLTATTVPTFADDVVFKNSGTNATLVELYSSEGCSSCPPAEAWVSKLKDSPRLWTDLFPVVFHVDYWDGLGWPDRFARPAYTERQHNYASRLGQDSVYTPEFVTNGSEWRGFFDGDALPSSQGKLNGALEVYSSGDGKKVSASYVPTSPGSANYTVNVAVLGVNLVSDVKRGENSGRQLQHDFVVLGFASQPLKADKDNKLESGSIDLTSSTKDKPAAVVAWISADDGSLAQVAGGWLQPVSTATNE
jgi:hypothetical protein